ncbi:hypothetical protein [Luteolibacter sp. AS25]|uniref:hypothetical protein n=1 Tax=Luteolibacter sp. AS25 TaxID=3135776 RepID=UPI00398AAD25
MSSQPNPVSDLPAPAVSRRLVKRAKLPKAKPASPWYANNKDLKLGIWAYFLLLIFEGALRKWVLPSLATPLLVVRDPLAILLLGLAFNRGLLVLNGYIITMGVIGIVGIYTALYLGHGNFTVAFFGARILLFHFPLMFVIKRVFTRRDVLLIGKALLWITIPMTVLIALQFFSPQSAWVNRGVGGDTSGAGFSGSAGFYRPPGTFSFTNGNSLYYCLVCPFLFYFWLNLKTVSKPLLALATVAFLAAIPLSISRALFFQVALTLIFTGLAISRRPKFVGPFILGIVGVTMAIGILSLTPFWETATGAFTSRFELAGKHEGGLSGTLGRRFLGGLVSAVTSSLENPFFGMGQGMGTNVGAMFLSGEKQFLVAEGEWGRVVGELGPILGISLIVCRVVLTAEITVGCYRKLVEGDLLPWLLLSFGFLSVSQGGWSQPSSLGFCTMIGGLLMATLAFSAPPARPKKRFSNLRKRSLQKSKS